MKETIGRNDPCHCGSGKKYKKCHERSDELHKPVTVEMTHGRTVTYTQADLKDFEDEKNLARHEAAHAIGYWMLRVSLGYMQINDDREDKGVHADQLAACTASGEPWTELCNLPLGERIVRGRMEAFITLAGVFGGGDAASSNPLRQHETLDHLFQAGSKLVCLGLTQDEARREVMRLVPIVNEFFDDKAIWNMVCLLATILRKRRRLEGEEIINFLNTVHPVCKAAAADGKVAVLS
jgi:hypothetical protein